MPCDGKLNLTKSVVIVSEEVGKRLDVVAANEYCLKLSVLVKSKLFHCVNI